MADDTREAFEDWITSFIAIHPSLSGFHDGEFWVYYNLEVQKRWTTWQASEAHMQSKVDDMRSALIDALDDVGSVLQDYEGALPYKKERYAAQKATYENIKRLIAINSIDK